MAVQVSYPGVYIEEFAPGAPIQGVGTSTAAFLGPSKSGPLNVPTKITSWDQFVADFGDSPLDGFSLWYAVRGFFENGGQVCFVARVSNATFDELLVNDQNNQPTIRLQAREPGVSTPQITIDINDDVHSVSAANATLFKPEATVINATDLTITVNNTDDASQFRPADVITIDGTNEKVTVLRTEGTTIRLINPLSTTYNSGTVRLANLEPNGRTFRVVNAEQLSIGTVLTLSQQPGPVEDTVVVKTVTAEQISATLTTYRVTLENGLTQTFDLSTASNDVTVESFEFSVTVTQGGTTVSYAELGMHPNHRNYFNRVINEDEAGLINANPVEPPNVTIPPNNRPVTINAVPLTGGSNDDPLVLSSTDYKNTLSLLKSIDDVNIVAIPDRTDLDVQLALKNHCEDMQDRFAILDAWRGAPLFGTGSVESQRTGLESAGGFAALYYPWLKVMPTSGKKPILVPPSGHVAGIYARTDAQRGVHKAPAGIESTVRGALGLERTMSNIDQGQLNLQGINVIRVFQTGGRPTVWGARTTALVTTWQYVNVRRLFLYLEESIQEGINWAVFEPNNLQLWQKLKRTIIEFLMRVWRDGALFGAKAEDAFYVRIDETLNPFSEQALGRLHIEIGVRPAYPAEFIIVRIGIWQGGSEINEI